MRLRLLLWGVVAVVAVVLLWLAVRQFGAIGTLLVPAAAVGALAGAVAKSAGAKPIAPTKSRPRRPGPSAISPKPEKGKTRARPRRNRGRY